MICIARLPLFNGSLLPIFEAYYLGKDEVCSEGCIQ